MVVVDPRVRQVRQAEEIVDWRKVIEGAEQVVSRMGVTRQREASMGKYCFHLGIWMLTTAEACLQQEWPLFPRSLWCTSLVLTASPAAQALLTRVMHLRIIVLPYTRHENTTGIEQNTFVVTRPRNVIRGKQVFEAHQHYDQLCVIGGVVGL